MARSTKSPFLLVIVLLVISAALGYMMYDGFRDIDCAGVTCDEGQFCQANTCHPIYPPPTNRI
jgi:hypothetical protein